jgi:hypothetical protein
VCGSLGQRGSGPGAREVVAGSLCVARSTRGWEVGRVGLSPPGWGG